MLLGTSLGEYGNGPIAMRVLYGGLDDLLRVFVQTRADGLHARVA